MDKAMKVEDIMFESVQDAESGIVSMQLPAEAMAEIAKLHEKGKRTFAVFLPEKCLNRLILQMAFAVQRRRVTDRLWTPGTV